MRNQTRTRLALLASVILAACGTAKSSQAPELQFWHTFNSAESATLQQWLRGYQGDAVTTTILPFSRATIRVSDAIANGQCPDLVRIDATRIPGLVEAGSLREVPPTVWARNQWLPESQNLVSYQGKYWGIPQSLDGLALIRRKREGGIWPPPSLDVLERSAMHAQQKPSLGLLIDGYWFVAFLRASGADLPGADQEPIINTPQATEALDRFGALFHDGLATNLLNESNPSRAMAREFREGRLDVVFTGPWDLAALSQGDPASLQVAAFPGGSAPRGGQVLLVPSCSSNAQGAWDLATALTAPELQTHWARALGTIPVTRQGLANSGRVVNEFYQALRSSRPLPRHPRVPELFDDLTPAVAAVVGQDATATEALAGVGRAWRRLYGLPPLAVPQGPDAN